MVSAEELRGELANFNGTEGYHKLTMLPLKATDGIAYVAKTAGAFWLIDAIASYQGDKRIKDLGIQFWTLKVTGKSALLFCVEDKDQPILIQQKIGYTDFPEGEWQFYVQDNVIMLPGEY